MRKNPSEDQPAADNPKDKKSVLHKTFPIVGVGASAGGLSAISRLLKPLPIDVAMPHSAIATGQVNFISSPEEIARELERIAKNPSLLQEIRIVHEDISTADGEMLNKIFELLRSRTGNDFTCYKHLTIRRRINRRMVLQQIEGMDDYVRILQQQPGEIDALFQDLLINVTSFFRDPETFEGLKTEVFPRFLEGGDIDQGIRIWIPGCSTGEEVYSVAIALSEFLGERNVCRRIQIFASDIDSKALDFARQGIYPENICDAISPERLQRFFMKTSGGYQVSKSTREMCVFALQNVIKDPPFSGLDLICCRNLMIYFNAVLQKKVLQTFHYALHPGRYLMLGTSESIGSSADLYSLVDKKNKIYLKKSVAHRQSFNFSAAPNTSLVHAGEHSLDVQPAAVFNLQHESENLMLSNLDPSEVIINRDLHSQHFRGQTGLYNEPLGGNASLNLLKMVRQNLAIEEAKIQLVQELEQELLSTREYMQSIIRDQDTTHKKLQSAYKEIQSDNDELPSINEDSEAAKEVLQSSNETLATINEEHETRNQELSLANIDTMGNIHPNISKKEIV
jgi:two-component system CheB/CheR fusion protein